MKVRPALIEAGAFAAFVIIGLFLRTRSLSLEAVEHFDEGIYSSVLWHDAAFNASYTAREFYAPPLVPALIELTALLPGLQSAAPFVPSIVFGTLTILSLWWLARSWFGRAAGIFMGAVVAMSDYHVVYSRMALTDVMCLFWLVSSVGVATLAINQRSYRRAAIAGFLCGLAWWTKYTGWLPLAIVISGSSLWWIWIGRRILRISVLLGLLATMTLTAMLTFSPWWWHLQSVGGYAAVSANHAGYLGGLSAWSRNLATHLTIQFWMDGMFGAISLGLGMFAAAGYRWSAAECSTWNNRATDGGSSDSATERHVSAVITSLGMRFLAAGIALTVISLRIWTPLMLTCIALGGFGGIFLWPVLQRIHLRRMTGDRSPTSPDSLPLSSTDLESAPLIDPALGFCTTAMWFLGMLLTTPMYHPYSRLFFPLMSAIWIAAAGGVSWWLESNVSVARRMAATGEVAVRKSWAQHLVTVMLVMAVGSSFVRMDEEEGFVLLTREEILRPSSLRNRTSIESAAHKLADLCVLSARGEFIPDSELVVPVGENISPAAILKKALEEVPEPPALSADERRKARLVVYVFGEPALCLHLARAGVTVAPVSHLNLGESDGSEPGVPTYLVIGPNAKRTPGFWEMWLSRATTFDFVSDVQYTPSDVTLLDLFSPQWLSQHDESLVQTFELHRVK